MSFEVNLAELRTTKTLDLIFPWWRTSTWKSKQRTAIYRNHSVTKRLLFSSLQASLSSPNHSTPPFTHTVDIWRQRSTSPAFGQLETSPNFNYFCTFRSTNTNLQQDRIDTRSLLFTPGLWKVGIYLKHSSYQIVCGSGTVPLYHNYPQ